MELPRQLCSYERNATKPKHITYQLFTSCIAKDAVQQNPNTCSKYVSDFTSYIDTYTEGIIYLCSTIVTHTVYIIMYSWCNGHHELMQL